jgi:hypothetical protein
MSTSSYPHRQAIDECGGICYPGSVPNGTSLANCTITFTGLRAGTWYAVAVQVSKLLFFYIKFFSRYHRLMKKMPTVTILHFFNSIK